MSGAIQGQSEVPLFDTIQDSAHDNNTNDSDNETISEEEFVAGLEGLNVPPERAQAIWDANFGDQESISASDLNGTDASTAIETEIAVQDLMAKLEDTDFFKAILESVLGIKNPEKAEADDSNAYSALTDDEDDSVSSTEAAE